MVKLLSWNVNGLRSVLKKNFLEFLDAERPDILCLQEVKAGPGVAEQLWPAHYTNPGFSLPERQDFSQLLQAGFLRLRQWGKE